MTFIIIEPRGEVLINVIFDWFENYNSKHQDNLCPNNLLLPSCDAETLNKLLCVIIYKTRTTSGECYPPKSVYSLLLGILHYMRPENLSYPNFWIRKLQNSPNSLLLRIICSKI